MSDSTTHPVRWGNAHNHFLTHLITMPGWHKAVILFGGLLAVLGTVGQIVTKTGGDAQVHVTTGNGPARERATTSSTAMILRHRRVRQNRSDHSAGFHRTPLEWV